MILSSFCSEETVSTFDYVLPKPYNLQIVQYSYQQKTMLILGFPVMVASWGPPHVLKLQCRQWRKDSFMWIYALRYCRTRKERKPNSIFPFFLHMQRIRLPTFLQHFRVRSLKVFCTQHFPTFLQAAVSRTRTSDLQDSHQWPHGQKATAYRCTKAPLPCISF